MFFYQSNLVNMSTLFRCYNDECIAKINMHANDYYLQYSNKFGENDYQEIKIKFDIYKHDMINSLLNAYRTFSYESVKHVYLSYLSFYNQIKAFRKFDIVVGNVERLDEEYLKLYDLIQSSGFDYFIYLSCILPSILKFEKFETTKILISYIGARINDDEFYNMVYIVNHDLFNPHHQYNRKIAYTPDILYDKQTFIRNLY